MRKRLIAGVAAAATTVGVAATDNPVTRTTGVPAFQPPACAAFFDYTKEEQYIIKSDTCLVRSKDWAYLVVEMNRMKMELRQMRTRLTPGQQAQ